MLKVEPIVRGKQRRAVLTSLETPKVAKQILNNLHGVSPTATYQDLRHILRDFERKGLVRCLNSHDQTGRIYIRKDLLETIHLSDKEINLLAKILRSKIRLTILSAICKERLLSSHQLTASTIRKSLISEYPMSLNHTLSALNFLSNNRLIEIEAYTNKQNKKIYKATDAGNRMFEFIQNSSRE